MQSRRATSIPETLVRTQCYGDRDRPIPSGRMRCHLPIQSAVTSGRNAERGLTYAPHGQLHESFGRYEAPNSRIQLLLGVPYSV